MPGRRGVGLVFLSVTLLWILTNLPWFFGYRVLLQPSESARAGVYLQVPLREVEYGAQVVVRLVGAAARLGEARGYLTGEPLVLKTVAGKPGDVACWWGGDVYLHDEVVAHAREVDSRGRPMPQMPEGCQVLQGYFLVGTTAAASYDSRYFGAVRRGQLVGRARPVVTWFLAKAR